ncbi:MAG TPA: hypothetical protein VNW06_00090 [Cytophagaceae bacterium]|jgi:hypothetical protein|nr:hypothetical protein [Cytophagaceae bacterium]
MPNIQFNYRYRCSGNYKKFISVVFANKDGVELPELENLIQSKLIYGEYFYAAQWQLPEVFTDIVDFRIDPTWHEFESVAYTDDTADAGISMAEFMEVVGNKT